jgi:hypothetical protein
MLNWIRRVNLLWFFLFLLAFHALLYYAQGTPNWFFVALTASVVDTVILGALQLLLFGMRGRQRGK